VSREKWLEDWGRGVQNGGREQEQDKGELNGGGSKTEIVEKTKRGDKSREPGGLRVEGGCNLLRQQKKGGLDDCETGGVSRCSRGGGEVKPCKQTEKTT